MNRDEKWYNPICKCKLCSEYRYTLLVLATECGIEELPANYFWDETWEFIDKLATKA